MEQDWKIVAERMFQESIIDAKDPAFIDCPEARAIFAGKACGISELLEKFNAKPTPNDPKEDK